MTRPLDASTATALEGAIIPMATIVYLDVLNDPLFAWTGIGDLVFTAAQTGDSSLDNKTFTGLGEAAEISNINEGAGGSDKLEITLPGTSLNDPMMRQLIRDRQRWQFRRAIVWLMVLDPVTMQIAGKPFRIKTGRMDAMPYSETRGRGTIKLSIEGQQAYGNQPLNSRYSEQIDIDASDNSQSWVHFLANTQPKLGVKGGGSGSSSGGGGSGSGGNSFSSFFNMKVY